MAAAASRGVTGGGAASEGVTGGADAEAAVHAPEGNRRSLMFAAALATGLGLPPPPALAGAFGPLLSERLESKVAADR